MSLETHAQGIPLCTPACWEMPQTRILGIICGQGWGPVALLLCNVRRYDLPGVVVHAFNSSTREAEAGRSL